MMKQARMIALAACPSGSAWNARTYSTHDDALCVCYVRSNVFRVERSARLEVQCAVGVWPKKVLGSARARLGRKGAADKYRSRPSTCRSIVNGTPALHGQATETKEGLFVSIQPPFQ